MKNSALPSGTLNRYETILNSFAGETRGNSPVYSDGALQSRLEARPSSAAESEIVSVSCGVAGPVLTSYVLWTIDRAFGMGLKRLYFIARDGEVLLELARRLLPTFWPDESMELRYLWGSRHAWMLPSFIVSKKNLNRYVLQYPDNSSLKIILNRVGLTPEDCEAILPKYGFTVNDSERLFSRSSFRSARALIEDPVIQASIQNRAQDVEGSVLGYLAQEGLFDDVPYGMVDLGWAGVLKEAFGDIMSLRGKAPAPFFFFGRFRDKSSNDKYEEGPSELHAYHFDEVKSIGNSRNINGTGVMMEMFCASLSGGLRQYELGNGGYEPVLRKSNTDAVREWGFDPMRDSILRFAEKLADNANRLEPPVYLPPTVSDALLREFWLKPTRSEAAAWGQFPFEEDAAGWSHNRLLPPIKIINFWILLWNGRGFKHHSGWRAGIFATNPLWVRFLWLIGLIIHKILKMSVGLVRRSKD